MRTGAEDLRVAVVEKDQVGSLEGNLGQNDDSWELWAGTWVVLWVNWEKAEAIYGIFHVLYASMQRSGQKVDLQDSNLTEIPFHYL